MRLSIKVPPSYPKEREYIIDVLFGVFLGVEYHVEIQDRSDTQISFDNSKTIVLPDILFQYPEDKWLSMDSLPKHPLRVLDVHSFCFNCCLTSHYIPIIYGQQSIDLFDLSQSSLLYKISIPIDILGSAFFMLSRYEEAVLLDRDNHDRFPANASLAFQEKFLLRPIIDEYIEILWAVIKMLWPGFKRKKRKFTVLVSHDVDTPSRYGFLSPRQVIRAMAGDIFKKKDIFGALRGPWLRLGNNSRLYPEDPYNTFDWIMDVSERYGLISAFYFICGQTHKVLDGKYDVANPAITHLLRHIHERGHEIGLHPSYNTFLKPQRIVYEAERLKRICEKEKIVQSSWGGRMHYLRWETPTTMYGWEQAGMTYDSTMAYADHTGFRCGTCHEYPAFDPVNRKALKLLIRPLIAMECTVTDKKYMGLGYGHTAYEEFMKLKYSCRMVKGNFSMLWHNTRLVLPQERELYETVIKT